MSGPGNTAAPFDTSAAHFVDTSAVIVLMRRREKVGSGGLLPFATVAELSIGGFRARDSAQEWKRIEAALASVAGIVYPTPKTLLIYAELSAKMKAAGTPLPVNDLWIAAVAVEWSLPLSTNDEHFARIPGLRLVRP